MYTSLWKLHCMFVTSDMNVFFHMHDLPNGSVLLFVWFDVIAHSFLSTALLKLRT